MWGGAIAWSERFDRIFRYEVATGGGSGQTFPSFRRWVWSIHWQSMHTALFSTRDWLASSDHMTDRFSVEGNFVDGEGVAASNEDESVAEERLSTVEYSTECDRAPVHSVVRDEKCPAGTFASENEASFPLMSRDSMEDRAIG